MTRRDAQAGFTLVELMISLLLTLLALGLAAQVLMESAQVLTDTAAEQIDAPVPLALARIRGDVQSSRSYSVISGSPGSRLMLFGHPAGTLVYEQSGGELTRTVLDPLGNPLGSATVMRRVTDWSCLAVTSRLVSITFRYQRHAPRRSPLPTAPGQRGPTSEERIESILLALRGGGLGVGW